MLVTIVAAAVASLFSFTMRKHGLPDATLLSSLTFLTIGMTVFVQGVWAGPLARLLHVRESGVAGVLFLGGNGVTVAVARVLVAAKIPAAIMDSNQSNLYWAENNGITTCRGDVLGPFRVVFSTDPAVLAGAKEVLVIDENEGGGH